MNKKLLALLAVAAMGITVVGATPQTQFNKGEFQLDAGAYNVKAAANVDGYSTDSKWNFDGGLTYGITDNTAIQYLYHDLNVKSTTTDDTVNNHMHEVNLVQSLNKNFAVYGGYANVGGDIFDGLGDGSNNIAQAGVIAKADLTNKLSVYGKAGIGTKKTTTWEAGLGYKIAKDFDLSAGYRYINTELNDDHNVSFKGATVGLSYRFGGSSDAVVAEPVYTPAPVQETKTYATPKLDYYVDSIYFNSDQDVPRADQAANLELMVSTANQYPTEKVKLLGNTDTDANVAYNQALSERRVQNVAQYAINHGISADRLVGIANGENKPVATNATADGKAENRRVDVYINR